MAATRTAMVIGPAFHGYNRSIADALDRAGFAAKIVDSPLTSPRGLANRVRIDLAGKLGVTRYKTAWRADYNRRLVEAHRAQRPELVLVIRGSWVDAETLAAMGGSMRAVWFQDMVHRCDAPPGLMQAADKVFVFEGSDVRRTREEQGVESHFLPMGFDPKDYRPIPGVERDIDVSFVGMPYPERQVILDRLLGDFPGRRFRFVGRYVRYREPRTWLKYVERKLDGPARRAYWNGEVTPAEVNRLYARSKVVLNIHHKQSREGCNPRVFEIMGSGAFQLVDANAYLREHFTGTLAMYEGYDQLRGLVAHYLADPSAREAEAARSQAAAAPHTFDRRVASLLATCGLAGP